MSSLKSKRMAQTQAIVANTTTRTEQEESQPNDLRFLPQDDQHVLETPVRVFRTKTHHQWAYAPSHYAKYELKKELWMTYQMRPCTSQSKECISMATITLNVRGNSRNTPNLQQEELAEKLNQVAHHLQRTLHQQEIEFTIRDTIHVVSIEACNMNQLGSKHILSCLISGALHDTLSSYVTDLLCAIVNHELYENQTWSSNTTNVYDPEMMCASVVATQFQAVNKVSDVRPSKLVAQPQKTTPSTTLLD